MIEELTNHGLKAQRDAVRRLFEETIKASKYAGCTPLGAMTINGDFDHYMDAETDTMWIGFVLGVHAAD